MPKVPNTEDLEIDLDAAADAAAETPMSPDEIQAELVNAQLSLADSAERIADSLEKLVALAEKLVEANG